MPITQEQRLARKKHLGSSDVPAILGFSKWATAYDVWLSKTGRIPDDPNEVPTDYQEAGNIIEGSVLEWAYQKEYIKCFERDPEIAVPDTPIVVHVDAVEIESGNPIEVKTEGLFGPVRMPWGDAGSTEVPEYTCLQCQTHLMATDREMCHVPTFLGGRGFGYFYVERDDRLVELIKEQAIRFWNEYVLKDVAPPDSVPSLELIKKIRRVEGEPVELADGLVERWIDAKELAKKFAFAKDQVHSQILAALDGRPEGICSQGLITNYEQHRKETIQRASTFRVMRLKKVK